MKITLVLFLVFIAVTLIAYRLIVHYRTENIEKLSGLEQKRTWTKEVALIKTFYPVIKLLQPIISLLPIPVWIDRSYRQWLLTANLYQYLRVSDLVGLQFIMPVIFYMFGQFWFDSPILIALVMLFGFFLPVLWIRTAAKERQQRIIRELPATVDMIALSVRAGLDFENAIRRIVINANERKSDVIEEFSVLLNNMKLGMSRSDALEEFAQRVDASNVYSFVSVLVQADKLGASISETLIQQARQLREERFVRAEKLGAAASQKMMLPLMVFIFPIIFIMILAPYLIRYFYGY